MDDLLTSPRDYNFFQAVRTLQQAWLRGQTARSGSSHPKSSLIGSDHYAPSEPLSFSALYSLNSEAADIVSIKKIDSQNDPSKDSARYQLEVSFTGLTGTLGALPHHYSSLIQTRLRNKDHTLRDFLDLFNHRQISLFYRAWEKYRYPFVQERLQKSSQECLMIRSLYSLAGLGLESVRNRRQLNDRFYLKYGSLFAALPRSANSLERMLCDYFEIRAKVIQFCGRWMNLEDSSRSRLTGRNLPAGQYCQLGKGVVIGTRVWDVQSKYRIQIGPIDTQELRRYLPSGDVIRPICEAARSFTGGEVEVEIELKVNRSTLYPIRLGLDRKTGHQLGRNCWLVSREHSAGTSSVVFQSETVLKKQEIP
jgi:type VI secretion system protein ImpH